MISNRYIWVILMFVSILSCTPDKPKEEEKVKETEQASESKSENHVELTPTQFKVADIQTGEVSNRNLSDFVNANGKIDIPPSNMVSVSAPLGGFVRKTSLLQGMKVKKGQVLLTIENPDFIQIQQDYLETSSEITYAEMEMNRQESLSKENVSALKIYQQATTKYKSLKARLTGLRERLKVAGINLKELEKGNISNSAQIYAPISGSVTAVNINVGKYVNPTDIMLEIIDTDHLHVELAVFEKDISKLKIGQTVRFVVNDNQNKERLAKVYLINPKIDEDRTVRVHCHLEKDDLTLLPESFVKATIETGSIGLPALPDKAVVDFEGKSYVFYDQGTEEQNGQVEGYLFQMVEVQKGVSENGFTHVTIPADAPKAKVVLNGAYALLSKMKNGESEGHGH